MKDIWNTAFAVLGSIGSGGVIIFALSSWLGKIWAQRILNKEAKEYKECVEKLTKELERKNYISKVRFDSEFSIYKELCEAVDEMITAVYWLFPDGIDDNIPVDENEKMILFRERGTRAYNAYNTAVKILGKNCAFISQENYQLFQNLNKKCLKQIWNFKNCFRYNNKEFSNYVFYDFTNEIIKDYEILQNNLRKYLMYLDPCD